MPLAAKWLDTQWLDMLLANKRPDIKWLDILQLRRTVSRGVSPRVSFLEKAPSCKPPSPRIQRAPAGPLTINIFGNFVRLPWLRPSESQPGSSEKSPVGKTLAAAIAAVIARENWAHFQAWAHFQLEN